jgi:hypothetical protein
VKEKARELNKSIFKGRQIKIEDKGCSIPDYFSAKKGRICLI